MSLRRTATDVEPVADRTVAQVLRRNVSERPDQLAVLGPDGELTYRQLQESALGRGGGFRVAGVAPDDTVLLMLDNHLDFVTAWIGLTLVGGVEVPVNTAYRGGILVHVANDSAARVAVVEAGYLERFVAVHEELTSLRRVYVRGADGPLPAVDGWTIEPFERLLDAPPADPVELYAWSRLGVLYTSGTTGNSKGVTCPQGLAYSYASLPWIETGQRVLVTLPLFHIGGQLAGVYAAMIAGGTAVVLPRFSATSFWDDVRRYRCEQTLLLGAMASFLWGQPARPDDAEHPLRAVNMVPVVANHQEFADRFNLTIGTAYGLTEFSSPIVAQYGEVEPGLAGWVRDDFEARLVDENDLDVPVGRTGELVLRAKVPWANMTGYHNLPDKTQEAWRNLWFHTGDGMRQDERGRFFFVDRINDSLRVRGENVSSFEVESEILRHPDVLACAVVAVPSQHTEDEIKAVVVPNPGTQIDRVALLEMLAERLPYFMVPRYFQFLDELPTTPTQKVKKAELRAAGLTEDTWDRADEGYQVTREGLQRPTAAR